MIASLREQAGGESLRADVCIVGAGAAGISIALALGERGVDVLLLEGGGLAFGEDSQALYRGESTAPMSHYPLSGTRMRFLGGSTNCWTGFCMPLEASDLAEHPWVPYSGWPIDRALLDPYYVRAQPLLDLGPFDYDPGPLTEPRGPLHRFDPHKLENVLWHRSAPTRFGTRYREALRQSRSVRLLLDANATSFLTDEAGSTVRGVALATLEGRTARATARHYVLACGGIENPRMLLLSGAERWRGLGPGGDLVGRFFMEHLIVTAGEIFPTGDATWLDGYGGVDLPGGGRGSAGIAPTPDARRDGRILNAAMTVAQGRENQDAGYRSLWRVKEAVEDGRWPDDLATELWNIATDLDDVIRGVRAKLRGEDYSAFERDDTTRVVYAHLEQAPDPENRVTLDDEKDALGLPRARLAWHVGELERRTAERCARLLGEELGRLGVGRVRVDDWLLAEDPSWRHAGPKYHHMGTTRMSEDPSTGVVDPDCRVHGVDNLYVAGSSVFPTSGMANPTLTIVALALRLADHLAGRRS